MLLLLHAIIPVLLHASLFQTHFGTSIHQSTFTVLSLLFETLYMRIPTYREPTNSLIDTYTRVSYLFVHNTVHKHFVNTYTPCSQYQRVSRPSR